MQRVVWQSRHKFVYYDYESIDILRQTEFSYLPKLNSEDPIVIYEIDEGLPKVDTNLKLDDFRIKMFHERYYELLIFLSIIDSIANHINHDELNIRLKHTFKLLSYGNKIEIKDINTLRSLLIDSKNMFKDGYIEYMETGEWNLYNEVPIPFVMIDTIVDDIKRELGLEKHFALMLELPDDISKYTCMVINDYIASRCNGYLSMNVLLYRDTKWESYYANNGQFIEYVHDYTEIDLRKYNSRKKDIHE